LQFTFAKHRHRARCWRGAFSSMPARLEFIPGRGRSMSNSRNSRRTQQWRDTTIPRRPLLWLAAALLFTLPALLGALASWVPFLFLCGFLLSQDLAIAFCLFVAFALLIAALVQFHRGSSPGAFWLPLATTLKLVAQAAPVVVLLFLLFPRINTGFQFRIGDPHAARTGFSDRLSPGGIETLANSSDIAFRAEFPD